MMFDGWSDERRKASSRSLGTVYGEEIVSMNYSNGRITAITASGDEWEFELDYNYGTVKNALKVTKDLQKSECKKIYITSDSGKHYKMVDGYNWEPVNTPARPLPGPSEALRTPYDDLLAKFDSQVRALRAQPPTDGRDALRDFETQSRFINSRYGVSNLEREINEIIDP